MVPTVGHARVRAVGGAAGITATSPVLEATPSFAFQSYGGFCCDRLGREGDASALLA